MNVEEAIEILEVAASNDRHVFKSAPDSWTGRKVTAIDTIMSELSHLKQQLAKWEALGEAATKIESGLEWQLQRLASQDDWFAYRAGDQIKTSSATKLTILQAFEAATQENSNART